ncbi:MAG: hypothetical protein HKN33_14755 [Pyrinomonadaceae bacterium]|nr:hypothetical protein [Pyrinomonadaceae bacterium]
MHDWTLRSISVDLEVGNVIFHLRDSRSERVELKAFDFVELHVPRTLDWGPSCSVNNCEGPIDTADGKQKLIVELQSGHRLSIIASQIKIPDDD